MNLSEPMSRYDELSAGYAMGDLDRDEMLEFKQLESGHDSDLAFELLVTSLEIDGLDFVNEPLPTALVGKLHQCAAAAEVKSQPLNVIAPKISQWRRAISHPLTGWAAAAAVVLWAATNQKPAETTTVPLTAEILRTKAADLIEKKFTSFGSYSGVNGNVIWSDANQHGFMTLSGIPVNDPKIAQYQLWIVDPKRDEAPVDGGVFNVQTDGSPIVIPIVAKLALSDPQAFVITLEQPGGVVKSRQEIIVALAKN